MPIPILVVDDEPNFQAPIQSALGKRDFLVNAVSNGAEALTRLETLLFHFALIDLKLIGESGIDVLGRDQAASAESPCVGGDSVSGPMKAGARQRTEAPAYLTKPLDLGVLLKPCKTSGALRRPVGSL